MKYKKNPLVRNTKKEYTNYMKDKDIIIIGGPTASGKSSFALKLAKELGGEIVNADAIQIYEDLRILSARPSMEDTKNIPHHLFGYVDAWTSPSVLDWLLQVKEILPKLAHPIFVGGTGFYIDALIHGLSEIPDIPEAVRRKVRDMDIEEVKKTVKDKRFTDPQRLRRALEVQLTTGKTLHYFQQLPKKQIVKGNFHLIHLLPPREKVYAACAERLIEMLKDGVIEEVINLKNKHPSGGVTKAIGYPEICDYLDGVFSKQEMLDKILLATRHYAKRQMTWFRHQGSPEIVLDKACSLEQLNFTK